MSEHSQTYRFIIDAWDTSRLPMARLAEYMSDLAGLFGNAECVHFDRLEAGSAVLVQHVDHQAVAAVRERLDLAKRHDAPPEVAKPQAAINDRLAADMATGSIPGSQRRRDLALPWAGPIREHVFRPIS